jgi:hypothetical protein
MFTCIEGSGRPCGDTRGKAGETERFFGLADRWMAAELLRLCRHVRTNAPEEIAGRCSGTAESRMLWDIAPEIAARLGATRFLPMERMDPCLSGLDAFDFRQVVTCVFSRVRACDAIEDDTGMWDLLTRDVAAGNHLAIALDRVAPAVVPGDFIAATLYDAWLTRGVRRLSWSPDLARTG